MTCSPQSQLGFHYARSSLIRIGFFCSCFLFGLLGLVVAAPASLSASAPEIEPVFFRTALQLSLPNLLLCVLSLGVLLGGLSFLMRQRGQGRIRLLEEELAALRVRESKFRSVVESASEVIFVAQQGRIKFITPSVERLVGYTPEELRDHDSVGIIHPDDYAEVMTRHFKRLQGEELDSRTSFRVLHKNGDIRHVALSSARIMWDGEVGTLNVLTDLSERIVIEEALQVSENKLRSLFASMSDVIIVLDADGRYLDVAPTRTDLLFRPAEEMIGKTLFEVFPAEQAMQFLKTIQSALESKEPVSLDYALNIDGKMYWFAGCATHFSDNAILWVARDITARKLAEENLRTSEERFRFILNDITNIAIQGYDAERNVIFWNEASERLYGFSEAEAMGRKLEDLIIPDYMRAGVIAAVQQWVNGAQRIPSEELVLVHKNGTDVPVYSSHVMYTSPSGKKEMFCIDLELGPIRKIQQELMVARDKAEAANRAKSEFLANMSHEIRTPLNGVLGMLQLLQLTEMDAEQMEYVGHAVLSSKRLTLLLSDILDLSRIESNKLMIQNAQFSMRAVLEAVNGLFILEAKTKGLQLHLELDPQLPEVLVGDEHRLRQVLFNLVGNALKFTESGQVDVLVSALSSQPGYCRVLIEIQDTGCGIEASQLRQLFDPFVQASNSYVRSHQGAGLGLAIVKRLVHLMGGNIYMESVPGEGTSIAICLTLGCAQQDDMQERRGTEVIHRVLQGFRVLLVEDDRINQIALTKMLEKIGAEVVLAQNGQEALALLEEEKVDTVFMDIQMPVLDGISATKALRASTDARLANLPVIALTAYAMAGNRDAILSTGMDAYLAKPVSLDAIVDVLKSRPVREKLQRRV